MTLRPTSKTADHPLIQGAFYNVPQVKIGTAHYWNLKVDDIDIAAITESKGLLQQYADDAKRQYAKLFKKAEQDMIDEMISEAADMERHLSSLPNTLSPLKEAGDTIQFRTPPKAVVHPYVKHKPSSASTTKESD